MPEVRARRERRERPDLPSQHRQFSGTRVRTDGPVAEVAPVEAAVAVAVVTPLGSFIFAVYIVAAWHGIRWSLK